MIRRVRIFLLGDRSGKREATWLIFFLMNIVLVFAIVKEAMGVSMPQTWAFLGINWPLSVSAIVGTHVYHHATERTTE